MPPPQVYNPQGKPQNWDEVLSVLANPTPGPGSKAGQACPRCGSTLLFPAPVTEGGRVTKADGTVVVAAPRCAECNYNGGHFDQFADRYDN